VTLDDGHDSTLLDSGGTLETVGVDCAGLLTSLSICIWGVWVYYWFQLTTTEQLGLEVHVVEGVDGLIVVGLDLSYWRGGEMLAC
jgi:hypothetical protein